MRSPRSRRFWTPARRKDRGRFVAQFIEMLEDRRLMTGFVQGTVLDPNNQPIDAAIVTLSNSTYTASYTTESNGYYAFSSVPAGTYTLTETPPSGYAGSAATAVNATIDPISNVTTQNGSVSVTVQVRDVAGFTGMTYYNTDFEDTYGDTPPAINFYLNQNYGTSGSTPSFISEGDSEPEQLPISAQYTESPAATLGSASDPLTAYCINMFQDLNSSSLVFTVTGSEIPPNLGSGTSTANQGEIAYLYNTYASTLTSSSDAIESSGLQLAIWELIANTNSYLYGASGTGTVTFSQLVNPTTSSPQGNNIVSLSAGPYTSTTQFDGIINDAVSYLNAANGNSQIALGLLFTGPNSEEQSVMISGGINFDNTQQATPSITTAPSPTSVTLGPDSPAVLKDTAQLSGGVNPIGTITFTLVGPNGNTVDSETVPVNGDGAYTTPNGYTLPTSGDVIGTYQWNATFTDTDGQNSNASDNNNPNEQTVVSPASPTIVTTASGPVTLGPGAAPTLSDSAVLAGGYDEGGSLTFTLAGPNGFSYSQVDAVSGDGTYTASTVLPTSGAVAGTYTWSTTYSGDANDNPYTETGSASNGEQTVVSPASPTISTTASGPVTLGPGAAPTLSDSAVLSGGYDEGGSLTFTLAGPNGFSYSQVDAVSGNGTYTASTVLPTTGTVAGTYTWSTTYSGDANDNPYTEVGSASNGEQTVVSPASPTIVTAASGPVTLGPGAAPTLSDSAVLAGGYDEGGSLTFTLAGPNGFSYSQVDAVSGDGTYTASTVLPATGMVAGTYTWSTTYSGDANDNPYTEVGSASNGEQTMVSPASPTIVTAASGPVTLGPGAAPTLSDSAVLSGGYDEGGSLTFTLAGPNGFSYSQVDAVSGNGTYTASTVLPTTGTVAGTYTWSTTYSGDANDKTYTEVGSASNGEQTVVSPASPTISTTPSTSSSSCSSSTVIKDTATIAGGHSPTGTITFTLYNPNGVLVNTETVTVNGNGSYTTSPGYTLPSTGAVLGTYQWDATYSGDANNKAVSDINDSKEQITIGQNTPGLTTTPGGTVSLGSGITISGTKYLDLTGNGFSSDDVPQNGVTIDLYNSSWTLVASTTTSGNGTFSFSVSSPGTYYVEESVPSGYIQTGGGPLGSAGDTYYQVNAVNGNNYSGYNFDDFAIPNCSSCTGFTYEVATPNGKGGFNKATQVSDLSGHTAQGDQVSVVIPSGATGSYTLVVYSAPTSTFEDSNAYEQVIYQQVSGTYASTASCNHTLTVTIPCNDYQVDFVCGSSINELEPNQNNDAYGPDSAEVLYHAQDRYIDGDNSGTTTPSLPTPPNPTVPNPTSSPATTTQALTDSATLSGGYNPTGTITFYLMAPGSTSSTPLSSAVYTDKVTITGDGTVTTSQGNNPGGYMATVAGTYQWVVVYTGDSDNQGVTSGFGSEPETVAPLPSVTGTVYCDMNVNDALGSGDQGLAGITVTLTGTSAAGAAVNLTTTTNAAGVYSFTGLAPSNSTGYTITLTTPSGDFTETANVGTVNGTAVGSASSITTDTSTEAISKVVLNGTTQTTGINYNFPLLQPATLSGEVIDDGKDDCQQDSCDQGLAGVTVTLTGKNYQGTSVSVSTTTNSSGVYSFSGLAPSNSSGYTVTVSPPSGFTADADWVGTDNGTTDGSASSKSTICDITIGGCGDDAMCYDFSLIGSATCNTQTQSCSYWCGNTGQQQINNCNGSSSCTNLGNWLAQTCPNLFGGLQGCTNSQIAGYCKSWSNGSSSQKACAQVLSTALCAYVTNSNLCGGAGSSYGFSVSQNGLGSSTWNVGSNGSTIGLSNNQTCSVYSVLKQIDSQCSNGSFKNSSVANAASSICSGINGY